MRRMFLLAFLAALCATAAAQNQLEIIHLRHRTVDQVLPVLQPLVEPGGSLSGYGEQILVRASAGNRAEIKRALAAIDTPARRLVISVRHDNDRGFDERGAELSGSVGSGGVRATQPAGVDSRGTSITIRRGDDSLRTRVYSTRGSAEERVDQQVQVVEGGQAFIQVGTALPLPLRQVQAGPRGVAVTETVVYRDLGTGFYAKPNIVGDRVTISISPQQESLSGTIPGAIQSQRLATTVTGRLGEWIPLGGSGSIEERDSRGSASYSTRGSLSQHRVLLRVEEAQ